MARVDVLTREDVADLPHAVHRHPPIAKQLEVVRARRLEREVVPPRRPPVGTVGALERTGDHPADGVLSTQDPASRAAGGVQLLERDDRLVGRDLEHAVGRRVDDPAPCALVLGAQALDDLGARRCDVADHPAPRRRGELLDDIGREAVRVGRERPLRDDAHHLPVSRRGVHPQRALVQAAPHRRRVGPGRAAEHRHHVSEAEGVQRRDIEAADGIGDVREGRGPGRPEVAGVGQVPHPDRVEDDDACAGH